MHYTPNRFAVLRYLFERFEQALGLGALLAIVTTTGWLPIPVAVAAFILVIAICASPVYKACQRIREQRLEIVDNALLVHQGKSGTQRYPLADFHIVLYKSRDNKVYEFKLYTENSNIKLRHIDGLHELFMEICQHVTQRKKVRWWQFL